MEQGWDEYLCSEDAVIVKGVNIMLRSVSQDCREYQPSMLLLLPWNDLKVPHWRDQSRGWNLTSGNDQTGPPVFPGVSIGSSGTTQGSPDQPCIDELVCKALQQSGNSHQWQTGDPLPWAPAPLSTGQGATRLWHFLFNQTPRPLDHTALRSWETRDEVLRN